MEPLIRIGPPKFFRPREVVIENVLAVIPATLLFLLPVAGIAVSFSAVVEGGTILLVLGLALVGAGAIIFYCLPMVGMNPFVRYIVSSSQGPKSPDIVAFDCQMSLSPRLYYGWRGFLEDADDVGRLEVNGEGLAFTGDHIRLQLSFEMINRVTRVSSGPRVLWGLGSKIQVWSTAFDGLDYLEFHERETNTIPASRRTAAEMTYAIEYGMELARGQAPESQ